MAVQQYDLYVVDEDTETYEVMTILNGIVYFEGRNRGECKRMTITEAEKFLGRGRKLS